MSQYAGPCVSFRSPHTYSGSANKVRNFEWKHGQFLDGSSQIMYRHVQKCYCYFMNILINFV